VTETITIQNPYYVPALTMQQVYRYAEKHQLIIFFSEWWSLQESFNVVCHASICKTQREIYDEMVLL
jgi:hypothetical protein